MSVKVKKIGKKELIELAKVCIDRQVIKLGRLQDELVERRNKCLESKSFCTPQNRDAIVFDTLYDELRYKTNLFNKSYPTMTKCL
jgi:hypothetical protein